MIRGCVVGACQLICGCRELQGAIGGYSSVCVCAWVRVCEHVLVCVCGAAAAWVVVHGSVWVLAVHSWWWCVDGNRLRWSLKGETPPGRPSNWRVKDGAWGSKPIGGKGAVVITDFDELGS